MAAATWVRTGGRTVVGTMATTADPPLHNSTDGVNLQDVAGFTITVEADAGQTFSGTAGSFLAYLDDDSLPGVSYTPELDIVLPTSAVGKRRVSFSGYTVANPRGFLAHIANGILVTGGALTITYTCTTLYGART